MVLLAFGFNLFASGLEFTRLRVMATLLGAQTPAHYRERALGTYDSATSAFAELPADSRVLMLWETRGLICVPQCDPDETIDRWYADLRNYGSPSAVLDAWQKAGYTHLLYFRRGADFIRENNPAYDAEDWVALDVLLGDLFLMDEFGEEYQIYRLKK